MIQSDSTSEALPNAQGLLEREGRDPASSGPSFITSDRRYQPHSTPVPGIIYQFALEPDGVFACRSISPSCLEFLEVSAAAIEADPVQLLQLIHADDRESFQATMMGSAHTLQPWRWEGRFLLPHSGQLKWIQCDAQPEVQSNQAIVWTGLFVDVTSQRQLNSEVERLSFLLGLTERLQPSTNLYEVSQFALNYLVQSTRCAFGDVKIINGINGELQAHPLNTHVSGEFVATYGEPIVAEMRAALQKGQPYGEGLLWQVVETGKPLFVENYFNHPKAFATFRHPGINKLAIFPIPALDGTIIGVLTLESRNLEEIQALPQQDLLMAACRIIGVRIERTQAQERLQQTNANLAQTSQQLQQRTEQLEKALTDLQRTQAQLVQTEKMSSLGQLVAGVAHEINNPINFIYGNLTYASRYTTDLLRLLQLYQQQCPEPSDAIAVLAEAMDLEFVQEDFPRILGSMKSGADRVRQIVLSLRNFARLDEADKKQANLHEGLDNTLLLLQHRLNDASGQAQIKVIKQYGDLSEILCYPGELNQVFMNILSNAIDALEQKFGLNQGEFGRVAPQQSGSQRDRPTPTITLRTEAISPDRVRIRIADNGPGIPAEVRPKLFDPFFTTKSVGQGTGLGMTISYQIVVDRHQGTLDCHSIPGEGAEFILEIPVQ